MQADYIIIGQGICGTLLSRELIRSGRSVIVVDAYDPFSSGRVASGLINPVTGMRVVKTWMFDELMSVARETYEGLENELGVSIAKLVSLLEFHATAELSTTYIERSQHIENVAACQDEEELKPYFHFHYGISEVMPCMLVDMRTLQTLWREKLRGMGALVEESFDWKQCIVSPEGLDYKGIKAQKLVCCEGSGGMDNPYFNRLPFSLNKGEVLIAAIPGLPWGNVYKHGIKIAPWEHGLFWVGASFDWKYEHLQPTETFRANTEQQLKNWLKLPFTVTDHWASCRPATVDHKPLVGFHPLFPAVGIFNGMGTKGCSQAPYFARQMAAHMINDTAILPDADIKRYTKILSR